MSSHKKLNLKTIASTKLNRQIIQIESKLKNEKENLCNENDLMGS